MVFAALRFSARYLACFLPIGARRWRERRLSPVASSATTWRLYDGWRWGPPARTERRGGVHKQV